MKQRNTIATNPLLRKGHRHAPKKAKKRQQVKQQLRKKPESFPLALGTI